MKINVLWIDALCINQKHLLERGLQVMRMGLIYSNAIKVLAWLCEKDDCMEMAMSCLHVEARATAKDGVGKNIPIPSLAGGYISILFRQLYWKRVWVIQGISKGHEVHVVCGSQSIEWNSLHATLERLDFARHNEVIALNYFRLGEQNRERPLFIRLYLRAEDSWLRTAETRYTALLVSHLMVTTLCLRQIIINRRQAYYFSFSEVFYLVIKTLAIFSHLAGSQITLFYFRNRTGQIWNQGSHFGPS
jgi:hypothetical protein